MVRDIAHLQSHVQSRDTLLRRPMHRRGFLAGTTATAMLAALTGSGAGLPGRAAAQEAGEPARGGQAVIALIQEPGQMNPFFNVQSGSFLSTLAVDPLFVADGSGEYIPCWRPKSRRWRMAASPRTS